MTAGLSSTFQYIQAQRDLANMQQQQLRAIIDYNRALVNFQAVQQAPLDRQVEPADQRRLTSNYQIPTTNSGASHPNWRLEVGSWKLTRFTTRLLNSPV